jgi:uncharacterized membrane protein
MHRSGLSALGALLVAACGRGDSPPGEAVPGGSNSSVASPPVSEAATAPAQRWDLQSSGEGTALVLASDPGRPTLRLFCPSAQRRLVVNVPTFRPIGSEERLSLGSGGNVAALVADTRGDAERGGVTATGTVPHDLEALIRGPVSVSYGAQSSGPHAPPPASLLRDFVTACRDRASAAEENASSTSVHPCLMQGSERLTVRPARVVGTEPFWGARIEGRCVTYSHPEDQRGTRVWTRYTPGGAAGAGTWTGALDGRRFELRLRAQPGCSDGMSDRRYPFAAELLVKGERRRGCAEPV